MKEKKKKRRRMPYIKRLMNPDFEQGIPDEVA